MALKLDADGVRAFLDEHFPQTRDVGFTIQRLDEQGSLLRLDTGESHLRPGGTVSGPTLMMLADTAFYLVVLSRIGPTQRAFTTSLESHFLRRAPAGSLEAEAVLLRLGRTLAVGQVTVRSPEVDGPVAVATVTYSVS